MSRSALLCLTILLLVVAACARKNETPQLSMHEAWSRPVKVEAGTTGGTGVVYLRIENRGDAADRLLRAHASICAATEIHQTIMQGDHMMMRPVSAEGLEIPPHGNLQLAPHGNHIMLIDLQQALTVGDSIEVHLDFAKSGMKTVYSKVRE